MQNKAEIVEKNMRIRFARPEDIPAISKFIYDYWDENYSYATNIDLLEYIHKRTQEVWYVVLETEDGSELLGTCGYIVCNQLEKTDVAVCLLKVKKEVKGLMGVKMLWFINQNVPNRFTYNCGLRTNTFGIYQFLQWDVLELNHYYRIADKEQYTICKIENKEIYPVKEEGVELILFESYEQMRQQFKASEFKGMKPYKDEEYLKWRYFDFPYYKYKIWGVEEEQKVKGLLIGREITYLEAKMLAIVDYIGEENMFSKLSASLQKLIEHENYEYIECFNYGFSVETMKQAGLVIRSEEDNNILPSHFEPFEQSNVRDFFFTTNREKLRVFRADGNHDVPRYVQYIPL